MAVVENVARVGKAYNVRKRIPPECRAEFGVSSEFKTVSLGTSDKREAQKRAVPILAEMDARIAAIRARATGSTSAPIPPRATLHTRRVGP